MTIVGVPTLFLWFTLIKLCVEFKLLYCMKEEGFEQLLIYIFLSGVELIY